MKAFLVVKVQPRPNARLGFGDRSVGVQVYVFVFQASPQPLDEDVVHAPALAVHADLDAWAFSTPVKSVLVNWLPWSVLKISGLPNRRSASSRASTQKSACSVFEIRQASTARECQSMIATR